MQLVMIRPTKTDSCFEMSKKNACRTWSVTMTNDAITVNWTMIRIEDGIRLRIIDIVKFDSDITAITAIDITTEVSSLVVTARAEQIPSTWAAMGLSLKSGSRSVLFCLAFMSRSPRRG